MITPLSTTTGPVLADSTESGEGYFEVPKSTGWSRIAMHRATLMTEGVGGSGLGVGTKNPAIGGTAGMLCLEETTIRDLSTSAKSSKTTSKWPPSSGWLAEAAWYTTDAIGRPRM